MLKEAIEKIQQLCAPDVRNINGLNFLVCSDGTYTQIRPEPDMVDQIHLSSLDALVKFVMTEAVKNHSIIYITVPDHKTVMCFTKPYDDLYKRREYLYTAEAVDVPGWDAKCSMGFEEALIALRTRFQPATDTEYALRLLSNITTGGKVTYNDNGVATSIITKRGVDLQGNEAIKPIIRLRPYRTFQEVAQPESQFLIRINERGITFIEADGGMWKLEARNTVKKYLEDNLKEEVEAGVVVIAL